MTTALDRIMNAHRKTSREDPRWLDQAMSAAFEAPDPRPFRAALAAASEATPGRPAVIAEVKRRSPSKGDLAPDLDPAALAAAYEAGGAAAISVLTDSEFFGGSPADVAAVRGATDLTILRKDFTVDGRDVADARAMGADAVLLIVAALTPEEVYRLRTLAEGLDLSALIEVHDEAQLKIAIDAGADMIGVNQRDLRTFEVDPTRAVRLADLIPRGIVKVAESGIAGPAQVDALAAAGYDAILVGESLVTAADPAQALRTLRGAP
ncbi:MAG: indole-3-glycerol phosphate synthase [Actinomycetota bacterium]|jgi:indole-3-glycerol phosphate synthase|nr:indole-3-glycerol phosphate synthase [Actinomycetota bacterium]